MVENLNVCMWKQVANNDLEKKATGEGCITLGPDKPCHDCNGNKEYANKLDCAGYFPVPKE